MNNPKVLILGAVIFLLLIVAGVGGYFLVQKVSVQHEENVEALSGFGAKVVSIRGATDTITIGSDGQLQLPPSIQEKKLSPTEKVILAISREKEALSIELADAKEQITKLEREVAELRAYRSENERYAPLPLKEEQLRAAELLTEYVNSSPDAEHFNAFQKQTVALAAASTYLDILQKFRLSLDENDKDTIIKQHLPAYGFCVADGIVFVPNGLSEQRNLIAHFRDKGTPLLNDRLAEDLKTVLTPCLEPLNERVNALL